MFSKILTSALIAGAVAGLIAAVLQYFFVQPVLLHAEMFEGGDLVHTGVSDAHFDMPPFETMRNILTAVFSMLIYAGYGLVMVALMSAAEGQGATINARTGLVWGLAGFIALHLAPGFGLAPEVPGSSAADVSDRQIWWYATVLATMIGLWLIAFGKSAVLWGVAAVLILAPHIVGAPHPDTLTGPAPTELGGLFAARSFGVGIAAWALLGCIAGHLWSNADEA